MKPERYTQQQHEDNDATSVAVIQNDIKYVRADIADIKDKLERASDIYVTRTSLLETKLALEKTDEALAKRVNNIYVYGGSVLVIVTTVIVGAFFKLILKV